MRRLSILKPSVSLARNFSLGAIRCNSAQPLYGPMESQRSGLSNGIKVGCLRPMGHQVASCTIMFQAGSRYEVDDQLGASHFMRATSNASGDCHTSFIKTRQLQQLGASITCSSDRQSIAYTLRCSPVDFPQLDSYLVDAAARCRYNQWDINDRKQNVKLDLEWMTPEQRVIDLVQRACWSGPLGNSVFCEPERIGSMRADDINQFLERNCVTERCTVATYGLPFDAAMKVAEAIPVRKCGDPMLGTCPKPRGGVEFYDMGSCSESWLAVAVPGTGSSDLRCMMKHAIVAEASGTGYMTGGQTELNFVPLPPLGLAAKYDPFQDYKVFNISYLDTGIFGVITKASATGAAEAAKVAAGYLAAVGNLDFNQITLGKKRLQLALASHADSCVRVSEGLALMLVCDQQMDTPLCASTLIENITPDEICTTAKAISQKCCQMSVAIVGDVGRIPHDRDILASI